MGTKEELLICNKCGKQLSYLGSGEWGCNNCNYETNYDIEYFYNLGFKEGHSDKGDLLKTQSLKNQASIMMAIVGLLDHHKVEDLEFAINIKNRMNETRDVLRGNNGD